MKLKLYKLTIALLLISTATISTANVTTYCCDQVAKDAYLADLANTGVPVETAQESFEAGAWIDTGSTAASSVSRLGVTWSRNDTAGLRRGMGGGNVIEGLYLMFSYDSQTLGHAVPDGYKLSADGFALYGVGGWFRGSMAKLGFVVDGDPERVDFTGGEATVISWKFLGFIEDAGFQTLEIMSIDEQGGEVNIFFTDDVVIAAEQGGFHPPDDDNDGVSDALDNCLNLSNSLQRDTDSDGIGNRCDPDFDQSCIVNFGDVSMFANAFLSNDPLTDINGDGTVNFFDLSLLVNFFSLAPGPSALPNACSP